jgi:2-oxo-3-hexenedioate decarboxylase
VVGGIEVIDSRYEAFKFTLPDVIADNTSAARVVIGTEGIAPRDVDLATSAARSGRRGGHAARHGRCAARLARRVRRDAGQPPGAPRPGLQAGWIVMAGAPLDARPSRRARSRPPTATSDR